MSTGRVASAEAAERRSYAVMSWLRSEQSDDFVPQEDEPSERSETPSPWGIEPSGRSDNSVPLGIETSGRSDNSVPLGNRALRMVRRHFPRQAGGEGPAKAGEGAGGAASQ